MNIYAFQQTFQTSLVKKISIWHNRQTVRLVCGQPFWQSVTDVLTDSGLDSIIPCVELPEP
jgi:hypothetical protein